VVLRQGPVLHLHLHLAARLAAAAATIRTISLEGGIDRQLLLIGIGILAALFLVLFFVGETGEGDEARAAGTTASDGASDGAAGTAGAHGFPVPPMPTGGAVRGPARPLTFGSPSIRQSPTTSNAAPAREEI
jgi:NADH-quinone oxidoreductase subunit H